MQRDDYVPGTNQLRQVTDAEGDVPGADDLGNQPDSNNYGYNAIGQLIENKSEGITYEYNTSGQVTGIQKIMYLLSRSFIMTRGTG